MSLHLDSYNRNRVPALSLSNGFTLVEALVALMLLTVGLIPAFTQATAAINLSATIKNSLIAANLAQEGVEVVHALRDDNWFAGQPFNTGLAPGNYEVQPWTSPLLEPYQDRFLSIETSGQYTYDAMTGPTQSLFKRKITINKISDSELQIICLVTWRDRLVDKEFTVEEHLFDWVQ